MKYEPELKEICPNIIEHTEQPAGYIQWHEWAEKRYEEGYRQKKCPGCGLYKIWIKPSEVNPHRE
jgi:hypothetical protein